MVSRETTRPLRKLVPAVAIGVSALLGIVGCSAGQVAQTAEMESGVNGNNGQVGNLLLRDVMVAFPENGEAYKVGEEAPLLLTIVNRGGEDDELVGVTSPAGEVEIVGNAKIPARSALQVVLPADNPAATTETPPETSSSSSESESGSESTTTTTEESETSATSTGAAPTSVTATMTQTEEAPDVVGMISLLITELTGDLPFGKTVPVTFEFANAGKVTVSLPVAAPSTPRAENRDAPEGEAEEGH
jgi:copper(I)-binding protein